MNDFSHNLQFVDLVLA